MADSKGCKPPSIPPKLAKMGLNVEIYLKNNFYKEIRRLMKQHIKRDDNFYAEHEPISPLLPTPLLARCLWRYSSSNVLSETNSHNKLLKVF